MDEKYSKNFSDFEKSRMEFFFFFLQQIEYDPWRNKPALQECKLI